MNRLLQPLATAAAAIALVSLAAFARVGPPPTPAVPAARVGKLTPSEVNHTAGEILRGEVVSHTFVLTNAGPGDVTINEVRACCSCTSAAIKIGGKSLTAEETAKSKQIATLKTGERAELTLSLDTLEPGCGGKDGPITKFVNVYHTDASTSPLSLSIAGDLVTPYRVDPPRLDFGTVKAGATAKTSCIVTSAVLGPVKIAKARCASDGLASVTARSGTGEGVTTDIHVDVEILPSAAPGTHQTSVELWLEHPRVRAIVIPLTVIVEAPANRRQDR